jgi:elongation factor Ts
MNRKFVTEHTELANLALNDSKEALAAECYKGITVAEKLIEQTGVIGEN